MEIKIAGAHEQKFVKKNINKKKKHKLCLSFLKKM